MSRKVRILVCLLFLVCISNSGHAVIINSATGTENTTPPETFPYWDAIGLVGGGSCVHLGDGYFLTAYHVKALDNPSTVTVGGQTYNIMSTSWYRPPVMSNSADLAVFRTPATPSVSASNNMIAADATLDTDTMLWAMGSGYNRASAKTYWNSSWVEVTLPRSYKYSGYKWATSGRSKRWGTNTIDFNYQWMDSGYGNTLTYKCKFDSNGGSNEAAVAIGDSGGPVYANVDGAWQLSGIIISRDLYLNQPTYTSVYGNSSYFGDLAFYRTQVLPTPGDATRDGNVDFSDYLAMSNHFGQGPLVTLAEGDFNGDYTVNFADYLVFTLNFGSSGALGGSSGGIAGESVPEPMTCLLLLLGAAGVSLRRRG